MLPSGSREIWGLSLSTRVCLCPSVSLSFSLDLTSQCLVCVSHSSYWSLFLKRGYWPVGGAQARNRAHGPGGSFPLWNEQVCLIHYGRVHAGLLGSSCNCYWKWIIWHWGEMCKIVGQHYTLCLPEVHECYKYFRSWHKLYWQEALSVHRGLSPDDKQKSASSWLNLFTKRHADPNPNQM